jgi:hypothetical protein
VFVCQVSGKVFLEFRFELKTKSESEEMRRRKDFIL